MCSSSLLASPTLPAILILNITTCFYTHISPCDIASPMSNRALRTSDYTLLLISAIPVRVMHCQITRKISQLPLESHWCTCLRAGISRTHPSSLFRLRQSVGRSSGVSCQPQSLLEKLIQTSGICVYIHSSTTHSHVKHWTASWTLLHTSRVDIGIVSATWLCCYLAIGTPCHLLS